MLVDQQFSFADLLSRNRQGRQISSVLTWWI